MVQRWQYLLACTLLLACRCLAAEQGSFNSRHSGYAAEPAVPEHHCGGGPAPPGEPTPSPWIWSEATDGTGTFSSPIMLPPSSTQTGSTPWLSLADGTLELAEPAAGLCGYQTSQFAQQLKQVVAYHEESAGGAPVTLSLCNSGDFVQNFWVLSCPRQLADSGGADADAAGCTCDLADPGYYACQTGRYGFQKILTTKAGYWYYVVVQANPPDTGSDPSRQFQVEARAELA